MRAAHLHVQVQNAGTVDADADATNGTEANDTTLPHLEGEDNHHGDDDAKFAETEAASEDAEDATTDATDAMYALTLDADALADAPPCDADCAFVRHGAGERIKRVHVQVSIAGASGVGASADADADADADGASTAESVKHDLLGVLADTLPAACTLQSHGSPEPDQAAVTVHCVLPKGGQRSPKQLGEVLAVALVRAAADRGLCASVIVFHPRKRVLGVSIASNWRTPGCFCACAACQPPPSPTTVWAAVAQVY